MPVSVAAEMVAISNAEALPAAGSLSVSGLTPATFAGSNVTTGVGTGSGAGH